MTMDHIQLVVDRAVLFAQAPIRHLSRRGRLLPDIETAA